MNSELRGLAWLLATIGLGVLIALGLPFAARCVPWSWENQAGRLFNGPIPDACTGAQNSRAAGLLSRIVERLYPPAPEEAPWPHSVAIIPGKTVNAYALLGGRVYVFDGFLRQAATPDELAAVLAHEFEHVRRRHILQGVLVRLFTTKMLRLIFSGGSATPGIGKALLELRFNRDQESEADDGALARLKTAHIDVGGFSRFFDRMQAEGQFPALLSDHPGSGDRARRAQKFAGGPIQPVMSAVDWAILRHACGS